MLSTPSDGAGNLRIGLFAIGHEPYWPQFEGLERKLLGFAAHVADRLRRPGVDVVNLGMIDSPDRKSTRLNSSHLGISYAVFCLKKKNTERENRCEITRAMSEPGSALPVRSR